VWDLNRRVILKKTKPSGRKAFVLAFDSVAESLALGELGGRVWLFHIATERLVCLEGAHVRFAILSTPTYNTATHWRVNRKKRISPAAVTDYQDRSSYQ
jgi:hypothetical protein